MEAQRNKRMYVLWLLLGLAAIALALAAVSWSANAQAYPPPPEVDGFEVAEAVQMHLPDRAALEYLIAHGFDIDHGITSTDDGLVVTVIAAPSELAFLETLGFERLAGLPEAQAAGPTQRAAAQASPQAAPSLLAEAADTVQVLRADYWKSELAERLSIEAKTDAGESATLTAYWEPAPIFGITCSAAVGMGSVPKGEIFKYQVFFTNPKTKTDTVYEGYVMGADDFDPTVSWPAAPEEGVATYSWQIWVNGGPVLGSGSGTFDCDAPLPALPPPGSRELRVFSDVGVYIYHYREQATEGRPGFLTVVSSEGGSATGFFSEWVPEGSFPHYTSGYVSSYMDPTALYARIEALAAEFPELAEIIDAPYLTNGYRRKAMGLLNSFGSTSTRVVLTSLAWGHAGGNDILVDVSDPGAADSPLSVSVSGSQIAISLATDATGALTSTAADVVAAINADPASSALVSANTYRGNSGTGLVSPQSLMMSDYLSAPPEISRDPYQVRILRIGKHRDGSKMGVFFYAQEHAREWVPPLVTIETAERLLRNYYTGGASKELLDNLDIFILPSVNPDGGHYSFYDFNFQRKNMTNYCGAGEPNDLNARNGFGVDINRNYAVGSLFDGYFGASSSCSSTVFAGPAELSEPESSNVAWVPDAFPNIKFSMNIHSSGNYFMWSPAAYIVPGRISLPRPSFGEENYFYYASERILQAIRASRGLVVTPARTGPVIDVLYSAAGNSGDHLYYDDDIYAWDFEVGTSFQPDWEEAYAESQEFSNGLIEMLQLALDLDRDSTPPEAYLTDAEDLRFGRKPFFGEAAIKFATSEPAAVYYTLDGSAPTMASQVYNSSGIREPGEIIRFSTTTTVRWFAVDAAGNSSGNYAQTVVVR